MIYFRHGFTDYFHEQRGEHITRLVPPEHLQEYQLGRARASEVYGGRGAMVIDSQYQRGYLYGASVSALGTEPSQDFVDGYQNGREDFREAVETRRKELGLVTQTLKPC